MRLNLQILKLSISEIQVPQYRQRKEILGDDLAALMQSIETHGLLQPIVVREVEGCYTLVAGHRRLSAVANLSGLGSTIKFGDGSCEIGTIPAISLADLSQLAAEEAELEENIRRVDLTWEERASATARLMDLRKRQAISNNGDPTNLLNHVAAEVRGELTDPAREATRREIILAPLLEAGAAHLKGSKNLDEAWKAHLRQEQVERNIVLGAQVGATFGAHSHTLIQASCFQWLPTVPSGTFDVILTDPPYGMGASDFGDAGGRLVHQTHRYDDSPAAWTDLITRLAPEWFRVAKEQAHLYICCDIDGFHFAREALRAAGWNPHRTPLVNFKVDGSRVPWPTRGPQRKWELVLYAEKGGKHVTRIYSDVIETKGDDNLGHGAQKPVELYTNLLKRSAIPGDSVLDCFGGTGTIIPACHALQCRATYVEQDANCYGIAVARLKELK